MATQPTGRVVGLVVTEGDLDEREIEAMLAPTGTHVVFISAMFSRFNEVVDVLAPMAVPSPAWLEQARRNADERRRFLDEFGALDSEGVAALGEVEVSQPAVACAALAQRGKDFRGRGARQVRLPWLSVRSRDRAAEAEHRARARIAPEDSARGWLAAGPLVGQRRRRSRASPAGRRRG